MTSQDLGASLPLSPKALITREAKVLHWVLKRRVKLGHIFSRVCLGLFFFFCARARLSPGSNKLGSLLRKSVAAVKGGTLIAGGQSNWSQHTHCRQPAPGTPSSCRGPRQADSHTGWAARHTFPTPQSIFDSSRFYLYGAAE